MLRNVQVAAAALLLAGMVACRSEPSEQDKVAAAPRPTDPVVPVGTPDSIPEERPDTVPVAPTDSTTSLLALLPAPAGGALGGEAAAIAERAVFVPRIQRWFMARMVDSAPAMDIGRIDGGIGTTPAARAALAQVLAERSPIKPGMSFIMHGRGGAVVATVVELRTSGRRIVARLDAPAFDSTERVRALEWRGVPAVPPHAVTRTECATGDSAAVEASIARYVPAKDTAVSVLRGCFGRFRALVTVRPLEITPESVERVVLVRADGRTQRGRLRDLSYPLHELQSVLDVDGDGTQEIIVRSFRPAMETWAALRMTDSIAFTRFASGFTIERR